MDGDSARSSFSRNEASRRPSARDVSNFSKEELLAHIYALEMDIEGKDGIIHSLTEDLTVSSGQLMSKPPGYRLRLENTVTEQNLTIEALEEELEQKQKELQELSEESSSLKGDASREVAALKSELEKKKAKWKQEKKDLESDLKNLTEAYERERAMLNSTLDSEIDKNHLLEKQMLLLTQRLEELYQRGVAHDQEFEVIRKHLEDEMAELRKSCAPLEAQSGQNTSPEQFNSMRSLLAQCFTKNTELNAMVVNSEKFCHGMRDEFQSNLRSALEKIELLTADLKESEKRNAQLEEACELHDVEMRRLKEQLTNDFSKDMYHLNRAFLQLHQFIKFSWSSSCGDDETSVLRNSESSNDDVGEHAAHSALLNDMIERMQQFSFDVEKQLERFIELRNENEELLRENDILRQKGDEVDRYRESVVLLKTELDRIKERYELMEKNQENMIMTLKKDLEVSSNKCRDLQKDLAAYRKESNVLADAASSGLCSKCGDVSSLEVGRLSPISKFGVTSESTPPRAHQSNLITSTPFPVHLKGAGEQPMPTDDESEYQLALIRWMETCSELNKENGDLKNQISDLKMQVKDLEVSASGIREEMEVFDVKRKELEDKLSDYATLKNQHQQLTDVLKLHTLKIEGLESELKRQEEVNDKLAAENLKFEEKFKENLTLPECRLKDGQLDVPQSLLADLNNKVNEILLLKGKIGTLTHAKRALEENYEQLVGVKNLYVFKLEEANRELNNCRGEVERLLQNNIKLSAENKSYDKEIRMLKIRVNHLADLKERNWGRSEQIAEQMQKDILSICREAIEKKFECDRILSSEKRTDPRCEELDARHRIELLIKDNGQLVHEKEDLLVTIAEQQKIINEIQKESGCDARWIEHLDEVQNNLLLEIREQKEQHARIEEALRSTGSLHNELQKEKDDKKIKFIELAKLEKKYQTEKLRAQQLEMEIKTLKQNLIDRREMIKVLEEEKSELSNDLATVRSALETAQEKLEFEIQCNRLRFKQAALQNANNEVLESFLTTGSEEKSVFDLDLEYHRKVRQEVEDQYEQALQTMRHYLAADYAMRAQAEQSSHNDQLSRFKTIIEEQSKTIETLKSSKIIWELTEGKETLPEYKALLENMDKCKTEMEAAVSSIHDSDEALKIKKAFQEYFNYKLFLAQKLLQDEHRSQYALAVTSWEQLHDAELKLVKLQMEAEKHLEKLNENPQQLELSQRLNSVRVDIFNGEERDLTTSQYIFHILLKSYFSHIEYYSSTWCSAFRRKLKNIEAETRKEMLNFGNQIEKNMKDRGFAKTESLLCQGDGLVTAAKGFIESIRGFKSDLLSSLSQALDSVFHETKQTLGDFKKDNARLDSFRALEEDLETLKKEKEDAEKQYRAAVQLLTSDHDLEVKKLETILAELKHLSEIGCRADALLKLKEDLEEKHEKEVEELRTYFERKVADLEKNFSEEVFSQHSRKMSSSSSCADDYSDRDKIACHPDLQCESGPMIDSGPVSVDLYELFPGNKGYNEVKLKGLPENSASRKNTKKKQCSDCVGCAAKVLTRWILEESHEEVERELIQAITKQTKDEFRTFDRPSRLFTQDVSDWEVEDRRASVISKTIHQIGEECFKTIQDSFKTNLINKIGDFETLVVGKLTQMTSLLGDKNAKLEKLEKYIADTRRACREKPLRTVEQPRDSSANELDRLLKDREDLGKIKHTLKTLVSQMSHYVNESENDLLRQIKGELNKLCDDGADSAKSKPPDDKAEKHVHFGANLSNIIQELDDTLNESVHDWTQDSSTRFREDLHSCLRKLKLEAAGLYKLSIHANPGEMDSNRVESLAEALRKENLALQDEINELRMISMSNMDSSGPSMTSYTTPMEAVYGDADELKSNLPGAEYLQNKARKYLIRIKDPVTSKGVEDVLREGDLVIDELQNRCEDLQQQVEVADKQLRSTRQFLEEQAIERESERDEYSREVSSLQTLLREKDRECTAKQRVNVEVLVPGAKNVTSRAKRVEELSKDLKETSERLIETEGRERLLQAELKAAIDQVYVLRDIIRNLETQVINKSDKEIDLEKKLEALALELEERNGTQSVMAHEIETLRNQSLEDSKGFEQLLELEENIKLRFNSSVIRQFQAQIREMGKLLDHQTKELEGNHIGASNNSLSSPSEEISIREHIEFFNRSKTPEHCPSPVGLPVDDVNKLSEKIIRHARADEVILKKLSDQEIRVVKLTNYVEEIQAERDILHEHVEKLKNQIADANNKIDFLRHKADASNAAANRDIILENQKLKDALSEAQLTLDKINHQLQEKETQLENAEEVISAQQDKLRSLVQCDENALESMRLEMASILAEKNKLEGLVEKYRSDLEQFGAHPAELKAILADKNEDIKFLQETLARYQSESEKSSRSSKGLKVSFAEEASNSYSQEPSKLRDYPGDDSFHFDDHSRLSIHPIKSSTHREIEVSSVQHPPLEKSLDASLEPKNTMNISDGANLDKLRLEIMEKDQYVVKLEQQLADFKQIEQDLLKTKTELEDMVATISEDKKYYEERLTSMMSEIKTKDEKCGQLEKCLTDKGLEIVKLSSDVVTLQKLVAMTQEKLNEARMLAESGQADSETVARLENEIAQLQREARQLEDDNIKTKNEKDDLNSKISSLKSENERLEGDLARVEVESRTNAGRYEEISALREKLEADLAGVRKENDQLRSELSKFETVEKHLEKTQEHLTSLLSENESLQETLNNMRIAYENRIEEVNQLRSDASKNGELQKEVGRLKQRISELKKALKLETDAKTMREDQLRTLTGDFESVKMEKEALMSEKSSLAEANRSMREELDAFRTSVAALRNDLSSFKKKDGPYISLLSQIDCNEVKKLHLEVSKMISEVGQLEFERNCLQQELAQVKTTSAAVVLNEAELDRLSEQISRLEAVNEELKANSSLNSEQLRLEIVKLSQDIKFLQTIEREACEKLAASHDDSKKFGSRLTKMEKDLNEIFRARRSTSEKSLQTSPCSSLSSSVECARLPETENETQQTGTVHFDDLLIQPALNKGADCHSDQRRRNSTLETALLDKMRLIEDLRQKLRAEESKSRALRAEKLDAELNLKTLEKINNVQEKKLDIINSQMRQISSERLQLELDAHNEKTSRLHAENELSTERMKTQSMQMENINMMENMRARLKLAMENEGKLKALVLEKHDQYESVVAKLNSIMVMERYRSESENEGCSSSPQKRLAESQEQCRTLKLALENQERINGDLHNVMMRERKSLAVAQEQLRALEGECNKLRTDLRNEIIKREVLQEQLNGHTNAEVRLPVDHDKVQSLERECARLRERLSILQEIKEQWRVSAYTPVLEQLNELNTNVNSLANRKRELLSVVNDLEKERNFLSSQVAEMREERANLRLTSDRMDLPPSVSAKLDIYLGRYFRAESYRKSLIIQKKYLNAMLSGYGNSHENTLRALAPGRLSSPKRPSFKSVALTVVSITRMKFIVRKRKIDCETAYLGLLRSLGFTNSDALRRDGQSDAQAQPSYLPYSHSPPTKERTSEAARRHRVATATHSEYLTALQEVQKLTR